MLESTIRSVSLSGLCVAVPTGKLTTEMLYDKFGREVVDRTVKMVGVRESRHSIRQQLSSDLAIIAAEDILKRKAVDRSTVGLVLYVTQTPDYRVPSTAMIIQHRLGLGTDCEAMDINLGCSGFVYGLQAACAMLSVSNAERALLVFGDTSSKLASSESRASSILFGDASGALLLEKNEQAADIHFMMKTDGSRYPAIIVPNGAFRARTYTEYELAEGNRSEPWPLMNGLEVFNFSIQDVPAMINAFVGKQGVPVEEYDLVALHQANLYIMKQIMKRIKATKEQLGVTIDRYGNTSSASIPITVADRYGECADSKEVRILSCGFGVGLSWACADLTMNTDDIYPIIFSDEYFPPTEFDGFSYE